MQQLTVQQKMILIYLLIGWYYVQEAEGGSGAGKISEKPSVSQCL
jgi:hypothetical protein